LRAYFAGEHLEPLYHVAPAAVLIDQLANAVEAFAPATSALDTEHVELAFDIAKYGDMCGPLSEKVIAGRVIAIRSLQAKRFEE
jgi:hypothetical protein